MKWPSCDGKKVSGKFACIIGQSWKSRFSQISTRLRVVYSTICDPELRNAVKKFSNLGGYIPQFVILNWEMQLKYFPILGGVYSTICDPELRNAVKIFSNHGGYIPQLVILNWEMQLKIFPFWGVYSTTFYLELRNERFTLISFMGFPAILSTLQPFQIGISDERLIIILPSFLQ